MQLIDTETSVVHDHDGMHASSNFTSCERGWTVRSNERPTFTRVVNATTTCLWCACKRHPWTVAFGGGYWP